MRLVACGMLAFAILIIVGSLVLEAATGTVFLAVVGLTPLMLVLGIAGLIAPNVVRAIGKYGGHLSWFYKVAGWGLIVLSILITILVLIGLFVAGYQSDAPRPRRPAPRGSPSLPAEAVPPTAADRTAREDDPGGKADPKATKPLKRYPVTIAVPSDQRSAHSFPVFGKEFFQ